MNDTELAVQLASRFGLCVGKDMHGSAYIGYPDSKDVILFYNEGADPPAAQLQAVVRAVAQLGTAPGVMAVEPALPDACNKRTQGWLCSRVKGHDGACDHAALDMTNAVADTSGVPPSATTKEDGNA